jgi:hypothetical protein
MTVAVWQWAGIAWLATGLAVVCIIELASRSADKPGPLSQASILLSIAFCVALILGAPFLLLFIFGVCFQMLWQGRIPLSNRVWWPARAATFDVRPPRTGSREFSIPSDWLRKRITIVEAEDDNPGISDDRVSRFPEAAQPFGFLNRQWETLKAEMKPSDELWTFISPADSWQQFIGRMGIALLRDGNVIDVIFTEYN